MSFKKLAAAAAATVIAATSLVACSSSGSDSSTSTTTKAASKEAVTIKIGTTDASKHAWNVFKEEAKKKGINLEVVNFSDYTTPNTALSEGQIDTNLFQHLKFLAKYNVGTNNHLVPVGATEIVPLSLYWKGHKNLDGIEGQSVVIPSDSSNQGRAINVLKQVGLVTLKQKDLLTPNPSDIDPAKSKVTVTPVDPAQTPAAYGEGRPAIINNTFLGRAGIDPKSAIAADDPSAPEAEPYINAFVTKADKAKDPNILELVEIWHSAPVQKANNEDSKGTSVEVKGDNAKLQPILDRLEKQIKKSS